MILLTVMQPAYSSPVHFGHGTQACSQWTQAKRWNKESYKLYQSWVLGFLTGTTVTGKNHFTLRKTEFREIMSWMSGFCLRFPRRSVAEAAAALVLELMEE